MIEIERLPFRGRRICQRSDVNDNKCHDKAKVQLNLKFTNLPEGKQDSVWLLCEAHADNTIRAIEKERAWNAARGIE
jgi:hypothetical protein